MATFTEQTKQEIAQALGRANNRIKAMKDKATEAMGTALTSFETTGTAFGFGYLRGRMTDMADEESFKIFGIPPDLLVGIGGHVLAFAGAFGKYDEHAHAIANGSLASFATFSGLEFGTKDRQESGEGPPHRVLSSGSPVRGRNIGIGAQDMVGVPTADQMATAAAHSRAGA